MQDAILEILLQNSGYISGAAIGEMLQVSRAAVWKEIQALRKAGYQIDSVTNKGYRLCSCPDILSAAEIKAGLSTRVLGNTIRLYNTTDSTNNAAKRESDLPDGTLFLAEEQTGGRGRRGNTWESFSGGGIWMSLLLKPNIAPANVAGLTLAAGLAVCTALNAQLPPDKRAWIKWPNDIVINGKKVVGILTELSAEVDAVNYVVLGIGINVNTPPFTGVLAAKATSLLAETGEQQNRVPLIRNILSALEPVYFAYLENGFPALRTEYCKNCITLGKTVKIEKSGESFLAQAVDLGDTGALVIEKDGKQDVVQSGEVSVRGIYGYI